MARQENFCEAISKLKARKKLLKIPMLVVPSRSSPPKRSTLLALASEWKLK